MENNHELSDQLVQNENKYFATASRINYFNLVIESAKDSTLTDVNGNTYLDLLASASASNVGHNQPDVVDAIKKQAAKLIHYTPGYFHHQPEQILAERLSKLAPGDSPKKVSFGNSGSDANDGIIKYARAYTKRPYIVSFLNAYHGSTYGSISLSALTTNMSKDIGPLLPGIVHVPFPDLYRRNPGETDDDVANRYFTYFKQVFDTYLPAEETACVIVEPIQGDGGIVKAPELFFKLIYDFCHEHGILFADDEVNQGLGRSGFMWGIENYPGLEPDLISTGKSLASGLPLSAVIGRSEIMDSLASAGHVFTTAANPICCAASLATLDILEKQNLALKSKKDGLYVKEEFLKLQKEYPEIGDVRMFGLNGGIELVDNQRDQNPNPELASKIIYYAYEHGVLMITLRGNILRFQPPLTISRQELQTAINVLKNGFEAAKNNQISLPTELSSMGW